MFPPVDDDNPDSTGPARFAATHWSVVLLAGQNGSREAEEALDWLCRTYWYPLYAFVRRQGRSAHDAQDLTQEFFAGLLRRDDLRKVDPLKGKFRWFLLAAMKHFLANDWDRARTQKRGAGRMPVSIDEQTAENRYKFEPVGENSPDDVYDRGWAETIFNQATERLRKEWCAAGKSEHFDQIRHVLSVAGLPQAKVARQLGMSEAAMKSAVHRMRLRFRELLVDEVGRTVASAEEIEAEMRYLFETLNH